MINYTNELKEWLRAESPLVSFARSIRGEGESANSDDASKADGTGGDNKEPQIKSLLEGIDLDELPEEVAEALKQRDADFATLQNNKIESDKKQQELTEVARNHQSRADRLHEKLRQHNLLDDGKQGQRANDPVEIYKQQFLKDGLKPELAEAYAKMFATAGNVTKDSIIKELTPVLGGLAQGVGDLSAERILQSEMLVNPALAIDEVNKEVRENVSALVQNGQPVSRETIQSLIKMAYGEIAMKNPEKLATLQVETPRQVTTSTRMTYPGAGHVVSPPNNRRDNGTPTPANAETAAAIAATIGHFKRGTPSAKGGKK